MARIHLKLLCPGGVIVHVLKSLTVFFIFRLLLSVSMHFPAF